jgi:PhnB protein
MIKMDAYLTFTGNCKEAMTLYHEAFGGELYMTTVGESPMAAQMPKETHDHIMHSSLTTDTFVVMASDMMGDEKMMQGNTIALCVMGEDKKELEPVFAKLSEGGKVNKPLEKEFFGIFGDVTDRFGFRWTFQSDKE